MHTAFIVAHYSYRQYMGNSAFFVGDSAVHFSATTQVSPTFYTNGFIKFTTPAAGQYLSYRRTGVGHRAESKLALVNEIRLYEVGNLLEGASIIEYRNPETFRQTSPNLLINNLDRRAPAYGKN